jgi:hypothetical protein
MKNKMMHRVLMGTLLVSCATFSRASEGQKYFVGGAIANVQGSIRTLTNNSMGYNINGGMEFAFQEKLDLRVSAAINFLPGKSHDGLNFGLRGYQIATDLVFATPLEHLDLVLGMSAQRWQYQLTIEDNVQNPYVSNTTGAVVWPESKSYTFVPGTKLGLRIGAEYKITPHVLTELLIQQTELGSMNGDPSFYNKNPSWVQLGVKYTF